MCRKHLYSKGVVLLVNTGTQFESLVSADVISAYCRLVESDWLDLKQQLISLADGHLEKVIAFGEQLLERNQDRGRFNFTLLMLRLVSDEVTLDSFAPSEKAELLRVCSQFDFGLVLKSAEPMVYSWYVESILSFEACLAWENREFSKAQGLWALCPLYKLDGQIVHGRRRLEAALRFANGSQAREIINSLDFNLGSLPRAQAWRILGEWDHCELLLRELVQVQEEQQSAGEAVLTDLGWEVAALHALTSRNVAPLLLEASKGRTLLQLPKILTSALWSKIGASSPQAPESKDLSMFRAESIRRSIPDGIPRSSRCYNSYSWLKTIERIEDGELRGIALTKALAQFIEESIAISSIEDELLVGLALLRACQKLSHISGSRRLEEFYKERCRGLTEGRLTDLFGVLGVAAEDRSASVQKAAVVGLGLDPEPLPSISHSLVFRMWKLSGMAVKVAGLSLQYKAQEVFFGKGVDLDEKERKIADQVLKTLGSLKGPLMKFGQLAGSFAELMPNATFLRQLAKLQVDSRRLKIPVILESIRKALGRDVSGLFAEFSETPLAAASLGQVHRAKLLDGSDVAVKVQYPFMERAVISDLRVLRLSAPLIKRRFPNLAVEPMLDFVCQSYIDECDYLLEAKSLEKFSSFFAGHPYIRIPRVHREMLAKNVLVMDYAPGLIFSEFCKVATQEEKNHVGAAIYDFMFRALYNNGWFYSDPHGGNYKIDGKLIYILDFGCVSQFDSASLAILREFARTFLCFDAEKNWRHSAGLWRQFAGMPPLGTADGFDDEFNHRMMCQTFTLPWRLDRSFKFTAEFFNRETKLMTIGNPNVRLTQFPPAYVACLRLIWGLHSVLTSLEAEWNWHGIMKRILEEDIPWTSAAS